MAGKCLSATHEAGASMRVIPICMAQGQAVGTAAALTTRSGVSPCSISIDTKGEMDEASRGVHAWIR
jgi:hypothetical protein